MVAPDAGCQDGCSRCRISGCWFQTQDVRMLVPDTGCQDGCSRCRMSGWSFQMQDGCSRHRMSGWLLQMQDVRRMVAPDAGCQEDGCSRCRMSGGWLFQTQDVRMVAPDAGRQDGCSRCRKSGGCSRHRQPQQSGSPPPTHQHEQRWSVPTKVEVHSQWMGTWSSSKSTTTFSSSAPDLSNPLPKR